MSREELAEAVGLWLSERDPQGREYAFDAGHLGKLERGTVRRPSRHYTDALCAILGTTETELGFTPKGTPLRLNGTPRRPQTGVPDPTGELDPDDAERLTVAAICPRRTDAAAVDAIATVLTGVRRLEDETSAAAVLPTVRRQRELIERLATGAPASSRPVAVGLSSEINQYLGWLSIPLGRWEDARRYLDRAAVLALQADDPMRLATALSFQAYAGLRTGDLRTADALSEAARRDTRVHIGLRTYVTYQRAEVLARDDNRAEAVRLLTEADRLVDHLPEPDELPSSGYWYIPAFFLGQRGFVLRALGDVHGARRAAAACLEAMPDTWRKSEWAVRRRQLAEE
jgi:transcriptional regulator with XRE-family HTH domain